MGIKAPKHLLDLAKKARKATKAAIRAQNEWAQAFERHYGHEQISDHLVELIDYARGDDAALTAEYIEMHSVDNES